MYSTEYQICLASESDNSFDDRLFEVMNYLSKQLGYTAEWYVPTLSGMVMKRTMSPLKERRVWAQEGFIRNWSGEVDAVYRVGKGGYGHQVPLNDIAWAYGARGKRVKLTSEQLNLEIDQLEASIGYADHHFNENGVRRSAIAVHSDGKFMGALAVAECWTPQCDLSTNSSLQYLQNACKDFFEIKR
jgi:hypothetical protein